MIRRLRREIERRRHDDALERAFIEDMAARGLRLESVNDLMTDLDYRAQVPAIAGWIDRTNGTGLQEILVRALSVPWAGAAKDTLIRQFQRQDVTPGYRWAVGSALEALRDPEIGADLLPLISNEEYGIERQMLLVALGRTNHADAVKVLEGLLDEPELSGHATLGLALTRDAAAKPGLERMLSDPRAWVRKEAERGLRRVN